MSKGNNFHSASKRIKISKQHVLLCLILSLCSAGGHADATPPCNTGTGGNSSECGVNASARNNGATAVGVTSLATGSASTAVGVVAQALGSGSTALGVSSVADGASTALGRSASAKSFGSTSVGYAAGLNNANSVTDSPASIALGFYAHIRPASSGAIAIGGDSDDTDFFGADAAGAQSIAIGSEAITSADGAIAIGGDLDGDGVGAFAGNTNAIAIGADVIAGTANTVTMGYPLFIKDKNNTNASRNLIRMLNVGPVGFRFEDSTSGNAWIFRQTIDGGFTMDALNTVGQQEVKFSEGGNIKINGTLTQGSSRTSKKNIKTIHSESVLDQLNELPIHQWTYKHEGDQVKHIGPMAEDFYKAFRLGTTSKGISSLDTSGVALAAIQALSVELDEKDQRIARLESQLARMDARLNDLIGN